MNIDVTALPDDVETLQRMVRKLAVERTALFSRTPWSACPTAILPWNWASPVDRLAYGASRLLDAASLLNRISRSPA
jgi:hypothetical protein